MTNQIATAMPDLGKLSVAQLRAIGKQVLAAKAAAIETERKNKPVTPRGRGVMDAIYTVTFANPNLKGDQLFTRILTEIKVADSNGRKTSKSAALTIAADFKHAMRFLKSVNALTPTAAAKV